MERNKHYIKSVFIRSCSGLHFPAFGLNTIRNFLLLWSKSYFWREIGYWALTPTNLEIFVIFSSFLRSLDLRCLATREETRIPSLLQEKLSSALLVVNQTYPKMLYYFIILFARFQFLILFWLMMNIKKQLFADVRQNNCS